MAAKSPIHQPQEMEVEVEVEVEVDVVGKEEELSRPTAKETTTQQQPLESSSSPNPSITPTPNPNPNPNPNPTLSSDIPLVATQSKETPSTTTTIISRPPEEPSPTDSHLIHLPSYSRWFSWNNIHECEVRFLPEFFDGRSPSKNPRVYKYYRNSIIRRFRENPNPNPNTNRNPNPNPTKKISFTEARKTIIGDVGSVRRVFDFLEAWGLINYSASASKLHQQQLLKWEDNKDTKSNVPSSQTGELAAAAAPPPPPPPTSASFSTPKKRICSGCKSLCTIACFSCDKYELTLCARCYVRGNYRVGVNSTDFRRVEINEEVKTDWTDKDTLQLLEAVLHYGDDWKKVAEYVGGRSEAECVARFIKLPFTEQFLGTQDSAEVGNKYNQTKVQNNAEFGSQNFGLSSSTKRVRLTPLADASNPIMAQAAFLSALVGVEVAQAAAGAAVRALSDVNNGPITERYGSFTSGAREQEPDVASNVDTTLNALEVADADVQLELENEEQNLERAISNLTEVKTKEIQDKIVHFEEFELRMEREWQQLQEMKNLLFVDQLSLLFRKTAAPKLGERTEERFKTE